MSDAKSASHTPPLLSSSLIRLSASCTWKLLVSIGRLGEGPAELGASANNESADDRDGIPIRGLVNRFMSCLAAVLLFAGLGRIESAAFRSSGLL